MSQFGESTGYTADLEFLKSEDTFSIMMVMLYAASEDPYYATLCELIYVLQDKFLEFLKVFQGQTIKVPTLELSIESMKLLLMYTYKNKEGLTPKEAAKKAGFELSDYAKAAASLRKFEKHIREHDYKIGEVL